MSQQDFRQAFRRLLDEWNAGTEKEPSANADLDEWRSTPRTPVEIREQLNLLEEYYDESDVVHGDYPRGIREVLMWVMGKNPQSPVTDVVLGRPPTMKDIRKEYSEAYATLYLTTPQARRRREQHRWPWVAYEHALFWASKQGDREQSLL